MSEEEKTVSEGRLAQLAAARAARGKRAGPEEPEEPEEPTGSDEETEDSPYRLWLAGLDEETIALFTADELAETYATALAKAKAEKKSAAKKVVAAAALHQARLEEGLLDPGAAEDRVLAMRNDEMVKLRIEMPTFDDKNAPEPIILDGKLFRHGTEYIVRRAVYNDLMALLYGANGVWAHYAQFEGKSRTRYSRQLGTMIHPGGVAAGSMGRHVSAA